MALPQEFFVAEPSASTQKKDLRLRRAVRDMKSVLVAFSGGVDSSYLALVAKEELGRRSAAVIGLSPSVSEYQRTEARRIAGELGLRFDSIETDELGDARYRANDSDRCYFCKTELYGKLCELSRLRGFDFVADGTNFDDVADYRPGRRAAGEMLVRSPLAEAELTKNEIRELSKKAGIALWDKPSSPCLSSRVAPGVPVTIERLQKVEAAEDLIRSLGFAEFRVRAHGEIARLELNGGDIARAAAGPLREKIIDGLRRCGFRYVTLDLEGFRSGSMNPPRGPAN